MNKINRRTMLALSAGMPFFVRNAFAAESNWPDHAITLIVPFSAGGGADTTARAVGNNASKMLGQPLVVENRTGGNAVIGANAALSSAADGYTLLWDSVNQITNQLFVKDLPFNYSQAFTPVSHVARFPGVIAVRQDFPAKTIGEFIAYAKANPGQVTCGTHSTLSMGHLALELLQKEAGFKVTRAPYKGGADAVRDIMGGQIDAIVISSSSISPAVAAGKARPLALTGPDRIDLFPDTPTLDESGFKGFNMDDWAGLFVRSGTPDAIVTKLSDTIAKACKDPEVVKPIAALGTVLVAGTPKDFADFLDYQRGTVEKLVKELNLKPAE